MELPSHNTGLRRSLTTWLIGFFGAVAAFLLLPRTLKYVVRRFVFSLVSELIGFAIVGLLTEKVVDAISDEDKRRRTS